MGGISTSVIDGEHSYVVKTAEGADKDEFIVTRHGHFQTPINVINIYGEQESRTKDSDIEERWSRIYDEIVKIEKRKESCIIIGDLNKKIGNDDLGIKNNDPMITFGGELVRALLSRGDYVCLNNHPSAIGGPFTRKDPASGKLSCLDFVIISINLLPFFKSITIDSERKFSPIRPIKQQEAKHSDHFPIIVQFENIPVREPIKHARNAHTIWNTKKEGGWEAFKASTNDYNVFEDIIEEKETNTKNMMNLEKLMNKKKFAAFGKVKIKNKTVNKDLQNLYKEKSKKMEKKDDIESIEKAITQKLLEIQKDEVEKEIEEVMTLRKGKGRSAAIFNTLNKICGAKKSGQDQVAMIDPESKLPIFDPNQIKSVSLKYCVDLLTKRNTDPEFEDYLYIQDMLHLVRCEDALLEDKDEELRLEDFEARLKILKTKCKDKYKFLINSGEGFRECVFELFSNIWRTEDKPQQWRDTIIIQLYKGKGDASDYNNQRNIHTKEDIPKYFEGIVVDKSKGKLTQACSKFQIGGIPGHRPQEHLFTAKSIIGLYNYLDLTLFMSYWDLSKYFDKETLRDAMDTLYQAGIRGKLYRLWYMLSKDTQIRVKTSFGLTETAATGENVAQGSIGGAIVSSVNLDKTITSYFSGAAEISYLTTKLSPLIFQDDTMRFGTSIDDIQQGNILISQAIKSKQLELNIDKSGVIIFGKKKKVNEITATVETNQSFQINDIKVKVKSEDKYLGDYLHSAGLAKSVEVTVAKRYGACLHRILELKSVIEDFRMHSLGGIKVGLEIFNLAILPTLLYNADTWLEIDDKTVGRLESLQKTLMRCLLAVPKSTPCAALNWDTGLVSMEYRVFRKKLLFLYHLRYMDESSLANEIFTLQKNYNLPGAVNEGRLLLEKFSLPNIIDEDHIITQLQWKKHVKTAVNHYYEKELKGQITDSSKLQNGPMVGEEFEEKSYLTEMSMSDARTLFRIRSRTNDFKMNQQNRKDFAHNLWKCSECGNVDTQSHILWCPYFASLREGKSLESDLDLVKYFKEVFKIRDDNKNKPE